MTAMQAEPELYDVESWRKLVEDLRAAPEEDVNQTFLFCAEVHLRAIQTRTSQGTLSKTPTQAA